MRIILISVFYLIFQNIYSQEYSGKDIIGIWEVNKCELLINGEIIKTAYINNYGDFNKVIEGKSAGSHDQDIISLIKSILGSEITFNEDSTVLWDVTLSEINFSNGYWDLENSGELFIGENKYKLKYKSVLKGRITLMNSDEVKITFFTSGIENRISLIKK